MTTAVRTRIQLKNILFATDFSPASGAAVPYAAELAKHYGAKLYALHVHPSVVNPMTPPGTWAALERAVVAEEQQQRRQLLGTFAGVEPEVLIKEGDLRSNIAGVVAAHDVDLIVMGTRGRSGIRKFMLGSSAEEIFRQAPCPVLTVGPHAPSEPKQGEEFSRILYASDFSPESVAAAPYAISLAQEYQAYLTLLHVIEEPKVEELVHPSDLVAASTQLLRNLVPADAELWCAPEYVVERGITVNKILEVAAAHKADLIVLGMRKPSSSPRAATHLPITNAHKIVSQAACPVLTVRG